MSPIRVNSRAHTNWQPTQAAPHRDLSRKEKTGSFLKDVLPMALQAGTDGIGKSGGGAKGIFGGLFGGAKATTAASTTSAMAGAGSAIGIGSSLASAAGIFGGIMGAANIAMSWGKSTPAAGAANGMAVGATVGTMIAPGIGTAIGAAIGAIGGGLLGSIKTGKHQDQKVRDQVRAFLLQSNILDSQYKITLADGSKYDIGIDGGPKAELGGRRPFEVDFSNPLAKYAVSWMNPVIDLLSQGNEKVKTDFAGYFANAALSNAKTLDDVRANVNAIIKQFGVSDEALAQGVIQATQQGQLDEATAKAYLNGIDERMNPNFQGDWSGETGALAPAETQTNDVDLAEDAPLAEDDLAPLDEVGDDLALDDLGGPEAAEGDDALAAA